MKPHTNVKGKNKYYFFYKKKTFYHNKKKTKIIMIPKQHFFYYVYDDCLQINNAPTVNLTFYGYYIFSIELLPPPSTSFNLIQLIYRNSK